MGSALSGIDLRWLLGSLGQFNIWKVLAIVFALLNLKSLPFAWHTRVLYGFIRHGYFLPRISLKASPSTLFQPMIYSTRNSLMDCDYNLHKSNSTYFQDSDLARLHLIVYLAGPGIQSTGAELGSRLAIILGGVSCNFKREIKPLESFEVWSRILCWDQKWLYTINHFVKKDSVKPKGYTLQPWRQWTSKRRGQDAKGDNTKVAANGEAVKPGPHPAIFATAIAKYVFKHGRITIPPERILKNAHLLPPKPSASASTTASAFSTPPLTSSPFIEGTSFDAAAASALPNLAPSKAEAKDLIDASMTSSTEGGDIWDWERVETERQRGMRIAELYAGLEGLNEEFTYEDKPALGIYTDFAT